MSYSVTFDGYRPTPRFPPTVTPWTQARIEESATPDGPWAEVETIVFDGPDTNPARPRARSFTTEDGSLSPGWYRVVFVDDDGDEELTGPVAYPPIPTPAWRPTMYDVAAVLPAFTRGPIDGDEQASGAERSVFDDTTDPTASEVEGFIDAACDEVQGRVGTTIPASCFALASVTAKWHAAASIEAEKAPEASTEVEGAYRWKQASYVACLKDLIDQARRGLPRLA